VTYLRIGMLSYYSYRNSTKLLHLPMLLTLKKVPFAATTFYNTLRWQIVLNLRTASSSVSICQHSAVCRSRFGESALINDTRQQLMETCSIDKYSLHVLYKL